MNKTPRGENGSDLTINGRGPNSPRYLETPWMHIGAVSCTDLIIAEKLN
jgi:hypothetical protein